MWMVTTRMTPRTSRRRALNYCMIKIMNLPYYYLARRQAEVLLMRLPRARHDYRQKHK
ncbi:unnamed protein product [Amoebophrya sp. A120]|nr:unnamed protein product [Amoebophrya sp. A120]|eukprot:GSA120T00006135001.1